MCSVCGRNTKEASVADTASGRRIEAVGRTSERRGRPGRCRVLICLQERWEDTRGLWAEEEHFG